MRHLKWLGFFFLVAWLSGCASSAVYKSHYEYSPPEAERGRVCVAQCKKEAGQCRAKTMSKTKHCAANPGKDTVAQQEELLMCQASASNNPVCNKDYRICYQLCGGKVAKADQCVANCPATV